MEQKGYPRHIRGGEGDTVAKNNQWGMNNKGPESCSLEVLFLIHRGGGQWPVGTPRTLHPLGLALWGVNFSKLVLEGAPGRGGGRQALLLASQTGESD